MKNQATRVLAVAAFAAVLASGAHADIALGGSKAAGMGGAGLALGNDPSGPGARNPAWYGLKKKSGIVWPQLRYSLTGLGLGDLDDFFKFDRGLDDDNLSRIARNFGDRKTEFGVGLGLGAQFGGFAVDIRAEGFGSTNPNPSLKNWVDSGANLAAVPADAVLDGYGLGTIDVGIGAGHVLPLQEDRLAVGGRFKITRTYYTHHIANQQNIQNGGSTKAPEMGNDDVLEETGFGLDAGLHWSSGQVAGLSGALLINNLITPNVSFNATRPNSASTETLKPFKRSVDLGLAFDKGPWLAAVDLIDVTGDASQRELRLGGEVHAGRWVAVRAGYGSRSGPTLGVGLAGFNIAYGRDFPVQVGYSFRF